MNTDASPHHHPSSSRYWGGFAALMLVVAFFLWTEHRAHVLGALPYVVFLLCPFIHLFMHRGHGKHGGHHDS